MTLRAIAPTTGGGAAITGTTITATTGFVAGVSGYAFVGDTTTGWIRAAAGIVDYYSGNASKFRFTSTDLTGASTTILSFSSSPNDLSLKDSGLSRISAGVIGAGTGAAGSFAGTIKAVAYQQADANGQILAVQSLTELTTIAAAATTDTTIQMPAGAIVLAVDVRVTVVIPTAATFTVGDSGSAARFNTGASVAVAAGTTNAGTKAGAYYNASALSVRLTPDVQPADNSGRVRVTIHYISVQPATS
jgi:hypothetical protein